MAKFITEFNGEYSFLSNFYEESFMVAGVVYPTVEHYYQVSKTNDVFEKEKLYNTLSPGKVKRLGRKVTLRNDWEDIKFAVMEQGVYCKFAQNDDIRKKLLNTKDKILIEGNNWHDNYWGDCYCDKCVNISGENKLGKILMIVRDQLK